MWTHVNGSQSNSNTAGTSVSVTLAWSAAAGNVLVASFGIFNDTGGTIGISDSGGNTWILAGSTSPGSNLRKLAVWTCRVTTGGTLTITATYSASVSLSLLVDEFACSGTMGANEGAVSAFVGGNTPSPSPGAIVPTGTDLLYTSFASATQGGAAATISTPFSVAPNQVDSSAGHCDVAAGYALDQTSSQTPVWTLGTSSQWSSVGFAIKGTSGGGGGSAAVYSYGPETGTDCLG